ncbi:shikimate kinase [Nakamurella silvestris]|nr:shikimate kinase [Nakamurella silvestris]
MTPPTRPSVVLIGAPGAGKSTVGAALAVRLGQALRDTDADIEVLAGQPIPDIFTEHGEEHFRALERAAVVRALDEHHGVLALGGGAVLAAETRAALRGHAVVFLSVSMSAGVKRTGLAANRPLLVGINPRATYKALLDARLPLYREVAVVEIDTDHADVDHVVDRIIAWLDTPTDVPATGAAPGDTPQA